jgi:A/G-specific adenine glycosylase
MGDGVGWSARERAGLRRRLLRWYDAHRRLLPWRVRPDPYGVLVSELMLQQTRVATVIPYYECFLARFPTIEDLARAPVDQVLAAWSGLGYYRRARHLHAAARRILSEHGGRFPRSANAVRDLPGVGRYTAGAIRSIAFGEPEPVVDGNAARVLARLLALDGDPRAAPAAGRLWAAAADLVDRRRPGDFNQALMELGATVCTPASPDCPICPWSPDCRARREGRQAEIPARRARAATAVERAAAAVFRRSGRCLLVQRREPGLLEGLWELPGDGGGGAPGVLAEALRRRHRLWAEIGAPLGEVHHAILDRRIRLRFFGARLLRPPRRTRGPGGWRWIEPRRALDGAVPLTAAARKVLLAIGR